MDKTHSGSTGQRIFSQDYLWAGRLQIHWSGRPEQETERDCRRQEPPARDTLQITVAQINL